MFSVSRSQLSIMAKNMVEEYLDRITARISGDFPVELGVLPVGELRSRVQAAFDRLSAQNFKRKEYLYRLIVLELLFGPQFETRLLPAVRRFAFPPPEVPCPPEAERFWAIYRVADQLTYTDGPAAVPSKDMLNRS